MSIDSAPRALVDMDGVLVRPDIAVDAEMTRRFPDVTPLAGHPNFYVAHDYPPEYRPQVWGIMHEPVFSIICL